MTEFYELVKEAPNFNAMERGELVTYAYAMFAAGTKADSENAKLRELCGDMMWTIRHAHGYFKNDTHEMLMTYVRGRDGKPTHVAHSLTCDEEEYERRMTELGIEVEA